MDQKIPGRHNYIFVCQTIRRRPRAHGLHSRRILKGSLLKRRNRAARLEQARARSWRLHTRQHIPSRAPISSPVKRWTHDIIKFAMLTFF